MKPSAIPECVIVFTDLDGTLLDHHTYHFDAAGEMLAYLKSHDIPLILVTSKTASEVLMLQKKLGIEAPFVVENGAGIVIPDGSGCTTIALGRGYEEIRTCFLAYAKHFSMRGFGDMDVEAVMALTGLDAARAEMSKTRGYSEPFLFEGTSEAFEALQAMALRDGLRIVRGGRFYHLIEASLDKAVAVKRLREHFEKLHGRPCVSLALGDSENDLGMLGCVTQPILIPKSDGSFMPCDVPNLIRAPYPGPKGWNAALKEWFDGH